MASSTVFDPCTWQRTLAGRESIQENHKSLDAMKPTRPACGRLRQAWLAPEWGGSLVGRAALPYQGSPGAAKAHWVTLALGLGGPRGFLVRLRGPAGEGTTPRPTTPTTTVRHVRAGPRSLGVRALVMTGALALGVDALALGVRVPWVVG